MDIKRNLLVDPDETLLNLYGRQFPQRGIRWTNFLVQNDHWSPWRILREEFYRTIILLRLPQSVIIRTVWWSINLSKQDATMMKVLGYPEQLLYFILHTYFEKIILNYNMSTGTTKITFSFFFIMNECHSAILHVKPNGLDEANVEFLDFVFNWSELHKDNG